MKTETEEIVYAVIAAEITMDRIETLVGCLHRLNASFGSDSGLFSCLEEDILADQPDTIRFEVKRLFYATLP
jgi:hypothetical protein